MLKDQAIETLNSELKEAESRISCSKEVLAKSKEALEVLGEEMKMKDERMEELESSQRIAQKNPAKQGLP